MKNLPDRIFQIWRAYFSIEPWPEERAELLNAVLCSSIHRDMTGESLPVDTWLPRFDETLEQRKQRELAASLDAWISLSEKS